MKLSVLLPSLLNGLHYSPLESHVTDNQNGYGSYKILNQYKRDGRYFTEGLEFFHFRD